MENFKSAVEYLKNVYDKCPSYEEYISDEDFEIAKKIEKVKSDADYSEGFIEGCLGNDVNYSMETPMIIRLREHLKTITPEQFCAEIKQIAKELGLSLESNGNNVQKVLNVESTQISDIEISKEAHKHGYEEHSFFTASTSNQKRLSFFAGAKWYRQQLKERL